MTGNSTHEKRMNAAAYKRYAASKPKNLTPPRTFVNAGSKGLYTGNNMNCTRPGAGQLTTQKQKPQVAATA